MKSAKRKSKSQPARSGRFADGPARATLLFSESVSFDARLYLHDIVGSIAHARGLARIGVLTETESGKIDRALKAIAREIEDGCFKWDPAAEDVHMNIENALVRKVGELGKKLHTARSRNDQVVTDLRLWMRWETRYVRFELRNLQRALVRMATAYPATVIPGYTHLQRGQPVLLAHHLLAYVEMFERDHARLIDCARRSNVCPLGSGALAGSTIKLDRKFVADLLGFDAVSQNSMDAVSDRDFVVEFHAAAALVGIHLSRLAEDLILWSSAEFGFITMDDAYTTGSSLMPQKKNPDLAELARGKSARLLGNLVQSLTLLKGLPLTYNRDLQEDKQPLFDSADTLSTALPVMTLMLGHTTVNEDRCRAAASDPVLLATDLVDFLVKRGVPFRQAHHEVGSLVSQAEQTGDPLPQLAAEKYGTAAGRVFDLDRAIAARKSVGSPSPSNVARQVARWKKALA